RDAGGRGGCGRLHREDELAGGARGDVERGAARRGEPGGHRGQRVAVGGLVHAKTWERGDAAHRRDGRRSRQRATTRVVAKRDGDVPGEAGHGVAVSVLRGQLDGGRNHRAGRRTRGLDAEDELRGRAGGDVERVAGSTRQPTGGGRERVAGAGLVQAQAREGGDAVRGGDRRSARED